MTILDNELENLKSVPTHKPLLALQRPLTLVGLGYIIYCFYGYFSFNQSLSSPLLPTYTISYVFGQELALNGLIAAIGILMSQLCDWLKFNLIASVVLLITAVIILVLTILP